jgi:DNA repair protein RecN (Recombination protein N)
MLSTLHIEDVAVIERADISFNEGFNVLTGETGAGKSIVIDAINMLLGGRTSKDIIRTGAKSAYTCGVFCGLSSISASLLSEHNIIPDEDGNIVIERELNINGRGSCKICGRPVSVSVLKDVGRQLINIHGQHDNQGLLNNDKHVVYLDGYAALAPPLNQFQTLYYEMEDIKKEIAKISASELEKERHIDLLSYQIKEIEYAQLTIGEEEELNAQRQVYQNMEKIISSIEEGYALLRGEDIGVTDLISQAASSLETAARYEPSIAKHAEDLNDFLYQIEDIINSLRDYRSDLEFSPNELNEIEERLELISKLKRKYGNSIEEILRYYNKITEELAGMEKSEERLINLKNRKDILNAQLTKQGYNLSKLRQCAAKKLQEQICNELTQLGMPKVKFVVSVKQQIKDGQPIYSPTGIDKVSFLISVNPGEPPKPISKIASGGELSRIMLSIQNILTSQDGVDTLIFDEIDTGISGDAANKAASKLRQISRTRQLLCVTHLAQIAAAADTHYKVSKDVSGERTNTVVIELSEEERVQEIARITAGAQITDLTLQNAREILNLAQEKV